MTSVVDTSVKYWSSQMDGAAKPTLNGVNGSFIALLDALIAGFDSKACTINVVGTVATVTWAGTHSCLPASVVMIAGCTGAWTALNGEQKITSKVAGGTTATFNVAGGTTAGAVSGSITIKMAPMVGWTKAFTSTNKASYRSTDVGATGHYLNIDDSLGNYVNVRGYETMTSTTAGTGPFPTTTQQAVGTCGWTKAGDTSATATGWMVVADARGFFFHNQPYVSLYPVSSFGATRFFGDPLPFRTGGDPWCCLLNYSISATGIQSAWDSTPEFNSYNSQQWVSPRAYTGLGASVMQSCASYIGTMNNQSGSDMTFGPFPSYYDGMLRLSKKYIVGVSNNTPPRAELPGFYYAPHYQCFDSFQFGQIVNGSGAYAGKQFVAMNSATTTMSQGTPAGSNNTGASFIDVTGPWR
jgi:hypothetical protein